VLRDAYGHGMLAFEREGHAANADPGALAAAFEYFRGCLNPGSWKSNPESQAKKRAAGIQPESGEALTVVGSYVAQTLAKAPGRLDRYHAAGPVPFFADYVAAYRRDRSIPRSLRLDPALEADLARWSKDWARTFNAQTRGPFVAVAAGAAGNTTGRLDAARLKASIAGASIYPDLADDLADLASVYTGAGDAKHALEAAELSASIYPDSAAAGVTLAATQAAFGDVDAARASLAKARGLEGGGEAASSSALNRAAYDLAGNDRLDAAAAWLRLAIELYPKDANLYDSLGELEAKGGHTDRAIEAYRKALELDPKLESSTKALEKLEKP
jgi:tetratricopeptide (TPR) repeat protein